MIGLMKDKTFRNLLVKTTSQVQPARNDVAIALFIEEISRILFELENIFS